MLYKILKQILKFGKSILKMMLVIFVIFMIPFILPIFCNILIRFKFFANIDEFKNLFSMFNSAYTFFYIAIGVILLLFFFKKFEDAIKSLFNNFEFNLKLGENSFSSKKILVEEITKASEQKEFIHKVKNESKLTDIKNAMKEMQEGLGMIDNPNVASCSNCNINELEFEINELRNFATFNIINSDTKSLLHIMYNEKYVEHERFKETIIEGYKERNKRNKRNIKFSEKDISKIANNKYESIFEGLKFLNIIEISEDDLSLKLTKEGKEFVEKYIEEKEVI